MSVADGTVRQVHDAARVMEAANRAKDAVVFPAPIVVEVELVYPILALAHHLFRTVAPRAKTGAESTVAEDQTDAAVGHWQGMMAPVE
jgi:hypothetical protein